MCGRFCLQESPESVAEVFSAIASFTYPPRYNIAPTQRVAAIRRVFEINGTTRNEMNGLHWGLVPFWAKDKAIGNRMINARAETVTEKPSFRAAFRKRRCLLPASGFYEWKKPPDSTVAKTPHFISAADGALLAMAGLWERWDAPDSTTLESTTILTTTPNELMRGLHDRMPVLLERKDWDAWLDDGDDGTSMDVVQSLMRPAPDGFLTARAISTRVNNPRNDDAAVLQ